jgi:type IX secretion system PorP/SprF family membrane protein
MKNQKLLIVIFLLISQWGLSQNARFSQVGSAPIQFNPSLTGRFDGKLRLSALYSAQETEFAKMQHQNISLDLKLGKYRSSGDEELAKPNSSDILLGKPVKEAKDEITRPRRILGYWGVGLNYYHYGDKEAPIKATFYAASLARHFYNKRNKFFGFGVQATYAQGNLDEKRGNVYDKEISGGTFRIPRGLPSNRVSEKNYVDFNAGGYYGMVTEAVMFELGGSMAHLFYPKIDILDKDDESKLRHRITAHSVLRVRFNDKWGLIQKNMYWQEGLYYRSKSFGDSLEIVAFWTGVEFVKVNPATNTNLNFGFYTRSFRTLMPLVSLNVGKVANLRYTYEHPINSKKHDAYTAKRHEVALILTYKRYTTPGTKFYKKVNFW